MIKRSSPGPVFYAQERMGLDGKQFTVYKFRTMPIDAEDRDRPGLGGRGRQPRATRVGALLRRHDLDEWPQFWNVLKGEMSIVGPRPERPFFVEQFKHRIPQYMLRHKVKAGITGWAQVNGWRGNTSLEKRIEYDLYYIENWSVTLDIKIMWLTLIRGVAPQSRRATDSPTSDHETKASCHASSSPAPPVSSDRILSETLLDRGFSVVGIDNLLTGDLANIAHLRDRDFQFIRHDVTNYIDVDGPVRLRAALGEPGEPDRLPRAADPDAEGRRARHAQGARPGQGQGRGVRDRLDLGGLRRSARASAEGNLLGQRQPGP